MEEKYNYLKPFPVVHGMCEMLCKHAHLTSSGTGLYMSWSLAVIAKEALLRKKRQAELLSLKWRNILPTSFRVTAWSWAREGEGVVQRE